MRNISQKRHKEVSKRALKGDWEMWCPEDQEKKMVMKGVAIASNAAKNSCWQGFRTGIHLPTWGAKPGWSRLKSGEELLSMRKTDRWELCCKESRDVMVRSRTWWQMGCKALAMQHLLHMWSSSSESRKGAWIRCAGDAEDKAEGVRCEGTSQRSRSKVVGQPQWPVGKKVWKV